MAAAEPGPGVAGEFHEGGAGQQDLAAHPVTGQPRVRVGRQCAGEHQFVGVREFDAGSQQRVAGGVESGVREVRGGRLRRRGQPEPLRPEGVRRQVHASGAGPREVRLPVDGGPADVQPAEGVGQCLRLGPVAAQRRDGRHGGVAGGRGEAGERAVGSDVQQGPRAVLHQASYRVVEADGPACLFRPVRR